MQKNIAPENYTIHDPKQKLIQEAIEMPETIKLSFKEQIGQTPVGLCLKPAVGFPTLHQSPRG